MRTYPCRGGGRTASWGGSRGSRASGARTCGETSSPPPPYLQDITANPSDPSRAQRGRLAPAATKWPPPASEGESRREEITQAAQSLRSPVGGGGAGETAGVSEEPDAGKP